MFKRRRKIVGRNIGWYVLRIRGAKSVFRELEDVEPELSAAGMILCTDLEAKIRKKKKRWGQF